MMALKISLQELSQILDGAMGAFPADFDKDGDVDIVVASAPSVGDGGGIIFYDNNGSLNTV